MKRQSLYHLITGVLLVGALVVTAACVEPQGRVYVRVGPPPPVVERVVVSPGPDFIWIAGYHTWNGNGYVWVPGRWERAPRPRARWVPGHWERSRKNGWYFVEGHWR